MSADHTIRYTSNGQTVTDAQTGLVWDVCTSPQMTHAEAIAYADSANAECYNGFSDWRVPTIDELQNIVDFTRSDPACDPVFRAKNDWYWSSSAYTPYPAYAWVVLFNDGYTNAGYKTGNNFVRLVRSGQ